MIDFHHIGSRVLGLLLVAQAFGVCVAEPLLVVTKGKSAQNVPTGTFVHGADIELRRATEGVVISDLDWDSSLSVNRDGSEVATVGALYTDTASVSGLEGRRYPVTVGLRPLKVHTPVYSTDGKLVAHFWGYDSGRGEDLLCSVYRGADGGRLTYRVGEKMVSVSLSAVPVLAMPSADGLSALMVLRDLESSRFSIQLCELGGLRRIRKAIVLPELEQRFGVEAGGMRLSKSGRYLYVAFSGYAVGDADGGRSSWVEVVDLKMSSRVGKSLKIEGALGDANSCLVPGNSDSCWVVSYTRSRSFGYVTHIGLDNGALKSLASLVFSGVRDPIRVCVSPKGDQTSLGIGRDIVVYDEQDISAATFTFDETVGALYWDLKGLVVGLENRIVRVNPRDGSELASMSFGTGVVTAIEAYPTVEKYDGDMTAVVSPRWIRSKVFREDRIGSERFVVGEPGMSMEGILSDDLDVPSWLLISPSLSEDMGDTLSIDLVEFSRNEVPDGKFMLPMRGDNFETLFEIGVEPITRSQPSILWVGNTDEPRVSILSDDGANFFSRIMSHLRRYPFLFHIDELTGSDRVDINDYSAVVLSSASAEHGVFTSSTLLDYLSQGGTILYLASADSRIGDGDGGRWLEALGMQLEATAVLNGVYPAASSDGFMRHWRDVQINQGTGIRTSDVNSILASVEGADDLAVAVSRTYGMGQVVVLASSSPFENEALSTVHGLRLVEGIFRQIKDSSVDRDDLDGDGIPDRIEDRNRNGRRDAGESDFANPDSDGDGIFDGIEDWNQNGFVDDIETNPLLSDTDEDGIMDAADSYPLPPAGAPYISSIAPNLMPGEGSGSVVIQGRNFTADSQIFFGESASPSIRLLSRGELEAVVPPRVLGSPSVIDVEIRNADYSIGSTLEDGFRYEASSSVRLVLRAMRQVRMQYGTYQLFIGSSLGRTPIRMNRASVIVEVEPGEAVDYLGIVAGEAISNDRSRMQLTVLGKGRVRVTLDGAQDFIPGLPLFEIQCRVNMLAKPSRRLQFSVVEKDIRTPYEGIVDSSGRSELLFDFGSVGHPIVFDEVE